MSPTISTLKLRKGFYLVRGIEDGQGGYFTLQKSTYAVDGWLWWAVRDSRGDAVSWHVTMAEALASVTA